MEIQATAGQHQRFPLPRWLPWCQGLILAVTLSFWAMFLFKSDPLGYVYKRDFLNIYVGVQAIAQGHASRLYDLQLQRELTDSATSPYHRSTLLPFVYPAYVAILLTPMGKLSLVEGYFLWTGINIFVIGWLIGRLLRCPQVFPSERAALLVAFFAWVPLQLTLSQGQMGLICTLALSEAALSLQRRKEWTAGCWLALGMVKPQLIAVPLLALLFLRSWRTIASFLMIACAVVCSSFALVGFWITDYVRFLAAFNRGGKDLSMYPMAMQNWRGLVSTLVGNTDGIGEWLLVALSLASVALIAVVFWGRDFSQTHLRANQTSWQHVSARFSIAILVGLLVSPHLYFHDWVVGFPALTLLLLAAAEWSRQRDHHHRFTMAIVWLIALSPFVCFAVQFGVWPANTRIQLVPWYMGLLTLMAAVRFKIMDKQPPGVST
jgi:hypothetical protein